MNTYGRIPVCSQFSPALVRLLPAKGDQWELVSSHFKIGTKLGEGNYGQVYKGTLSVEVSTIPAKIHIARQTTSGKQPYTVAVKLLKGVHNTLSVSKHIGCLLHCCLVIPLDALFTSPPPPMHLTGGADRRAVENFLEEIAMMKKVSSGECCHVVQMVGCVSSALPLALALEFVAFGDLLSYLRRWRQKVSKKGFVHQYGCSYYNI